MKRLFLSIIFMVGICGGFCSEDLKQDHQVQVTSKHETALDIGPDGLPTDIHKRDIILKEFYDFVIPTYIAWKVANHIGINKENMALHTPFPYNPIREPGIDKLLLLPNNAESWDDALKTFKDQRGDFRVWYRLLTDQLTESGTIMIAHPNPIASCFTRPSSYKNSDFTKHQQMQENALKAIAMGGSFPKTSITLSVYQQNLFKAFAQYQAAQNKKIEDFLNTFGSIQGIELFNNLYPRHNRGQQDLTAIQKEKQRESRRILRQVRPYFLGDKKRAHQVIFLDQLPIRRNIDAEVIVFENPNAKSRYVNYIGSAAPQVSSEPIDWSHTHSTAVSGIIAAKEELGHLEGIVPGAKILLVDDINLKSIEAIKNSTARVMNFSYRFLWPIKSDDPKYPLYSQFATVIAEKDMILVFSAGNEGLQTENIDCQTGEVKQDLTNKVIGLQYECLNKKENEKHFNSDMVPFRNIFKQIPLLKDRVILAGNLYADGVNIYSSSCLPGAFPDDFLYVPSEGIYSLKQSYFPNSRFKSEIGAFGGTSGAAPRITGVLALFGKAFSDLSMTEIRECILETGDAFWQEPDFKMSWLTSEASKEYGKRIFGRGRMNAKAAYDRCCDLQDQKKMRQLKKGHSSIGSLDLAKSENIFDALSQGKIDNVIQYYSKHPVKTIYDPTDHSRKPPLLVALENKHKEISLFLLEKSTFTPNEGSQALIAALEQEIPMDFITEILNRGIAATYLDARGISPLHIAAKLKQIEIVKRLVKEGVEVNIQDKIGRTPLHNAVVSEQVDNVKFLLESNANPNILDENKDTPLLNAVIGRSVNMITILVNGKADPNFPDPSSGGWSPLKMANAMRNTKVINILSEKRT